MNAYQEAIAAVCEAVRQRYRVAAIGDLAPLAAAVAAADAGDPEPLAAALISREMYRWTADVEAGIAAARAAMSTPVVEETPPAPPRKRVLSDLKLDELVALATANEIALPEKAKKADVFKLLKDAKVAVPQEVTGDGSGEPLPEGHRVGEAFDGHLSEGHLDEAWLAAELSIEQLREIAGEWELTVAEDATAVDLAKTIAAETVYYDPDEPAE